VVKNDFELEIIRPSQTQLVTVTWVEVEAITGSFTVGPNHSPLIAILRPGGIVRYNPFGQQPVDLPITTGIFSVGQDRAVLVFDR